jgi:hypothetical protein
MPSLCSVVLSSRLATAGSPGQWLALARQTLFCRRQPRKIDPVAFLLGLCLWAAQPMPSLRRAAAFIGLYAGRTISKQNIAKRFQVPAVRFVRAALAVVLARLAQRSARLPQGAFARFRRLLVQDSTAVGLPATLASQFPGNANGRGQALAVLKIQCIYDVLAERFLQWYLTSFRVNDQQAATDILAVVGRDDLVIRDLGYFSLEALHQIAQRGAFFLSRLWQGVSLWTANAQGPHGVSELDLLGALQRNGWLDVEVRLGSNAPLTLRLVAVPVPEALANERRRKARQNRDQRHPSSARRLLLMGWDIFITNVPATVWSTRTVCQVYGVRWRIEIVFKSAKSYFHLEAVPRASAAEVEMLIWARLLLITLLQGWLARCEPADHDRPLSLLKVAEFFALFCPVLLLAPLGANLPQRWYCQVRYHCRYEKRRRLNFAQKLAALG